MCRSLMFAQQFAGCLFRACGKRDTPDSTGFGRIRQDIVCETPCRPSLKSQPDLIVSFGARSKHLSRGPNQIKLKWQRLGSDSY